MLLHLDVVDLLQLEEIWSRRPVITAFTRLEQRPAALPNSFDFSLSNLMPRLARLKVSYAWRSRHPGLAGDPGRVPISAFSAEDWRELYPESQSNAVRQSLFEAVYNRFIVACYRGDTLHTCRMLEALARARTIPPDTYLEADLLPRQGAAEWIPPDITDEVRCLDDRYDTAEPGLPSTYVVGEEFWPLLVKAESVELEQAARLGCSGCNTENLAASLQALTALAQVAYAWNRSPSVVGLCYQVWPAKESR